MKALRLDEAGQVRSFRLNDKCAAGTGAFLEKTARYLGYSIQEIGPLVGNTPRRRCPSPGVCAVFAESEVINHVTQRRPARGHHARRHGVAHRALGASHEAGPDGAGDHAGRRDHALSHHGARHARATGATRSTCPRSRWFSSPEAIGAAVLAKRPQGEAGGVAIIPRTGGRLADLDAGSAAPREPLVEEGWVRRFIGSPPRWWSRSHSTRHGQEFSGSGDFRASCSGLRGSAPSRALAAGHLHAVPRRRKEPGMKAAVFYGPDRPLSVEDVPMPEAGPGQVLIQVAGCGVCHTDLHYLDHGTPTFKTPPMILGHEISGTVTGLGEGVTNLNEGDRVLVAAVTSCGACEACREGRENVCANGEMLGNNIDGGFAEYVVAPAKDTSCLPDDVPLVEGSIIADAITTPYHAVINRGKVRPGDCVVVFGCGGVGLNIVQVAAAQGTGRGRGRQMRNSRPPDVAVPRRFQPGPTKKLDKELRALTGGGVNVAFEAVGKAVTQEQALSSLTTGGRLVLVGYSPDTMTLNSGRVMFREIEVVGSLGCRPVDYPRAIEMVRQRRIRLTDLVTHRFPLEQIDEALDTLRGGDAIRVVVTP